MFKGLSMRNEFKSFLKNKIILKSNSFSLCYEIHAFMFPVLFAAGWRVLNTFIINDNFIRLTFMCRLFNILKVLKREQIFTLWMSIYYDIFLSFYCNCRIYKCKCIFFFWLLTLLIMFLALNDAFMSFMG